MTNLRTSELLNVWILLMNESGLMDVVCGYHVGNSKRMTYFSLPPLYIPHSSAWDGPPILVALIMQP